MQVSLEFVDRVVREGINREGKSAVNIAVKAGLGTLSVTSPNESGANPEFSRFTWVAFPCSLRRGLRFSSGKFFFWLLSPALGSFRSLKTLLTFLLSAG